MEDRLRAPCSSGREKDHPWMASSAEILNQWVGSPVWLSAVFDLASPDHPLNPCRLEEILVIGASTFGQRHQDDALVQQMEHCRDRPLIEIPDQGDDIASMNVPCRCLLRRRIRNIR